MITEIDINNIGLLRGTFIDYEKMTVELNNNPFGKLIVLQEQNTIIGYIYYSEIYERVEINNFEIDEKYRNIGNGDFLLKKLIEHVNKNITLEVNIKNKSAIHVYEKNNFKKVAIRKGYYNGTDGILMERNN